MSAMQISSLLAMTTTGGSGLHIYWRYERNVRGVYMPLLHGCIGQMNCLVQVWGQRLPRLVGAGITGSANWSLVIILMFWMSIAWRVMLRSLSGSKTTMTILKTDFTGGKHLTSCLEVFRYVSIPTNNEIEYLSDFDLATGYPEVLHLRELLQPRLHPSSLPKRRMPSLDA